MHRKGTDSNDVEIYQDFQVRRAVVAEWLEYLQSHHPTFQSWHVQVDHDALNQLPEDGSVHDRIRTIEHETMEDPFEEQGLPEDNQNVNDQLHPPMYSRGFVPNVQDSQTELFLVSKLWLELHFDHDLTIRGFYDRTRQSQ
jgi:hypothetical protein